MASAKRPQQSYQQDYIARIRYSNALPPPPCPPKLLDIPNTGLSSGQYTSAGFASRLAREQPLNIEADAELGMAIDLVGLPGVFDGDESVIQALSNPPPLHPADRALMRPPNALGKITGNASSASFLRRTEYITSSTTGKSSTFESSNSSNTMRVRKKRQRVEASEDDPANIARHIIKGFNLAYPQDANSSADTVRGAEILPQDRQAWKTPKNPRNDKLKLVGSYPLLPDWDAMPDTGSYMLYKFVAPPINNPTDPSYDPRLDVALLRPIGQTVEDLDRFMQEQEEHKANPTLPAPTPRYHFEFFLTPSREKVAGIKRNFTNHDPDADDIPFDEGLDDDGNPRKYFKFENIRTYETEKQVGDPEDTYGDVVALAIHDPDIHDEEPLRDTKMQKGAYFYPIVQRTNIRGRRPGKVEMAGEQAPKVHVIETVARDPEAEVENRNAVRRRYDPIDA